MMSKTFFIVVFVAQLTTVYTLCSRELQAAHDSYPEDLKMTFDEMDRANDLGEYFGEDNGVDLGEDNITELEMSKSSVMSAVMAGVPEQVVDVGAVRAGWRAGKSYEKVVMDYLDCAQEDGIREERQTCAYMCRCGKHLSCTFETEQVSEAFMMELRHEPAFHGLRIGVCIVNLTRI
uniref:Uncharacterized protein n=1 Tax=Mucochytrium quahogii TaxID=96639 RepID=A0A7S2S8U8_9STRA|mmetsp:Transcript_26408/g.57483  ORF Transcript_26408/g.57483 Transcript_26408/m.57483 type:complete len:177 (+) Transcript_26408:225-755(+)